MYKIIYTPMYYNTSLLNKVKYISLDNYYQLNTELLLQNQQVSITTCPHNNSYIELSDTD